MRRPFPLFLLPVSCLLLSLALFSGEAFAGKSDEGDVPLIASLMNEIAVSLSTGLPRTLAVLKPAAPDCNIPPPRLEPKSLPTKGEYGIYACEMSNDPISSPPSVSPASSSKPEFRPFAKVPGLKTAQLYVDNDNIFLGLVQGGNDTGYTFGGGITYEQILGKQSQLGKEGDSVGAEVNTQVYSAPAFRDRATTRKLYDDLTTQRLGGTPMAIANGSWVNKISVQTDPGDYREQQFLNVNQLKLWKEWDRKTYFVKGAISAESRQTAGSPAGIAIQEKWHKLIHAYDWKSYSTDGTSTVVEVNQNGDGTADVSVTPGVEKFKEIEKFGKWASTLGIAAGKRVELFQGRCQLQAMVSADVVVQGGTTKGVKLDANSHIAVATDAKVSVLKNKKWNDSRLNLSAGGGVMYFPEKFDGSSESLKYRGNAEIESRFHTGTKGNALGVAIQLFTPGGAGLYQKVDDDDPVMRIAVRYLFGTAKRR